MAKVNSKSVDNFYRKGFRHQIKLSDLPMQNEVKQFLRHYFDSIGSNFQMALGCILPIVSMLANKSVVRLDVGGASQGGSGTPLNIYSLIVCAPGGGKTSTFENIISSSGFGDHIVETYTRAALEKKIIDKKGMVLLACDEGQMFFTELFAKMSEIGFLNKVWSGQGFQSVIASTERRFGATSLSLAIFIQPDRLVQAFSSQHITNDGFMDRFLLSMVKPKQFTRRQRAASRSALAVYPIQSLFEVFKAIRDGHPEGVTYTLSPGALRMYDDLLESSVSEYNAQFASGEEDNGSDIMASEPSGRLAMSQLEEETKTSGGGREADHVLRVAVTWHIFANTLQNVLDGTNTVVNTVVQKCSIELAQYVVNILGQQRELFSKVIAGIDTREEIKLHVPSTKSTGERVAHTIMRSKGPMCTVRQVQRKLNQTKAMQIREEMKRLSRASMGLFVEKSKRCPREGFMKPIPESVSASDLEEWGMTLETYALNFRDVRAFSSEDVKFMWARHPAQDMIGDYLSQVSHISDDSDSTCVTEASGVSQETIL